MKIEKEVRYYFPDKFKKRLEEKIEKCALEYKGKYFIQTLMFDNPNPDYSFYLPEIDGRLRLRKFESLEPDKFSSRAFLSWKQRLKKEGGINEEIEIEVRFRAEDYENIRKILEEVLRCKYMGGYEMYRTIFEGKGVEVTINEYPFGIALEIEAKDPKINLQEFITALDLQKFNPYYLSNDDMYEALCKKKGIKPKPEIFFDDPDMPKLE